MSDKSRIRRERILYLLSPIGLLVVWQLLLMAGIGDRRFIPAPTRYRRAVLATCRQRRVVRPHRRNRLSGAWSVMSSGLYRALSSV